MPFFGWEEMTALVSDSDLFAPGAIPLVIVFGLLFVLWLFWDWRKKDKKNK